MTVITDQTAPDAGLVAGFAEPVPTLTDAQRIARLEETVDQLKAHASQLQGKIGLLAFEIAVDVLTRIRSTPDPAETLRAYIESAQRNGRKVKAPPDNPWREHIQVGIDAALAEHINFMMHYGVVEERLQA